MLALLAAFGSVSAQTPPVGAAAVETVTGFYSWYLDYAATGHTAGRSGGVVADRAYRGSPFLTRRLVQSIDLLVANADPNEGWGDDPFLQARGIPARISVELVDTARHSATVLVGMYGGVNPLPRLLAVRLRDEDGLLKIDDIRRDDLTPAGAAQRFYEAYLGNRSFADGPRPDEADCVGAAYVSTEAAQWAVYRRGIDPFTLSAALPTSVRASLLRQAEDRAEVLLERWFPGQPAPSPVVVWLQRRDSCWQIDRVHASVEPQMVAQVFYDHYLQAVRYDRAFGLPLANVLDAIRFPDYMTLWQLEEVRPTLTHPAPPDFDPVLNTENLPLAVRAELMEKLGDRATVAIEGVYPCGPGCRRPERLVLLDMQLRDGRWRIENILPQ